MDNETPKLDFGTFREELYTLIIAVGNKIRLEWPTKWRSHPEAAVVLRATVEVAGNTYHTIRILCADPHPHPSVKPEYVVSAPPLARSILDSLFTIVFLFEDLPVRTNWFLKSGWRELYEENQRYQQRYGSDPLWAGWLTNRLKFQDQMKTDWGVTAGEAANPAKIKWWPNPGKMTNHPGTSKVRRQYLAYLNDWFYKELSSASHLSWPGLASRSMHLLNQDHEQRDRDLNKFRSDCFTMTVAILVAVLSEIQVELGYDLSPRLKYIWGILKPGFTMVRELYEYRYEALL